MNPIVDKDFNYIIGLIIPKEILSLNPVIAGGFPLAIYRSLQIYKDPSSRGILKRWVADCYSQNKVLRYEALKRPRLEEFGDIDFWLLNSQIENESVDGYIQRSISSNIRVVNDSKWSISFKFLATDESDLYKDVITTESELLYQAVKKTFKTPQELIESFDICNSSIAWKDGCIYISDDLKKALDRCIVEKNKDFEFDLSEPLYTRVYRSVRYLKYAKRFRFDFSEDISKYVFNTYYDVKDFDAHNSILAKAEVASAGGYDLFMPSRNLLHIFREEFRYFACMDSFKEEYALYLIDSNLLGAMAKSLIDKESGFSVQVKPLLGTNLKTYNYNNSLTKNNLPF